MDGVIDEPALDEPPDPRRWRRADLGDVPEVGDIISAVVYPTDDLTSVIVYYKMRVEAVFKNTVIGPSLPSTNMFELPGRPDTIVGKRAFFWRPFE